MSGLQGMRERGQVPEQTGAETACLGDIGFKIGEHPDKFQAIRDRGSIPQFSPPLSSIRASSEVSGGRGVWQEERRGATLAASFNGGPGERLGKQVSWRTAEVGGC